MRALTLQVYVDDIESEEEGIAEGLLDNYTVTSMPRPGTSLKNPGTAQNEHGIRPKTQSGIISQKQLISNIYNNQNIISFLKVDQLPES